MEVASHRVAREIRERIVTGDLPPGTRIFQDELADELHTSRIPVRDALRILQSNGLVTLKSNRGAWVIKLSHRQYDLNYKIREELEPLLIAESLAQITDEDVAAIVELQRRIEEGPDDATYLALDRELHFRTYKGHEGELMDTVTRLWDTTAHHRRMFTKLSRPTLQVVFNAEHQLLIEALRNRDAEDARAILAMHIRRTRRSLAQHPEIFE
ncbi:GntR family transcriptional regulator [Pseudonocardia ailaonensis]|uniref:GntR family transcriptional regulator n=1 Tax=Pseudonocardia ailaonensis TaxID=367279 RepID=A0ABN2N256_9PSEU